MKIAYHSLAMALLALFLLPIVFSAGAMFMQLTTVGSGGNSQLANLWQFVSAPFLRFTLVQSSLSAGVSVLCGVGFAFVLFYSAAWLRHCLIPLLGVCFTLPSIVVALTIVEFYGREGIVALFLGLLGVDYPGFRYGLVGILLGHSFLNIPFATLLLYHALLGIPSQNLLLLRQFAPNMWRIRWGWTAWRALYWPYLAPRMLQAGVLIFLMCFSSFALVLTLGKGPGTNTLEVEIYQALRYEFDFPRATLAAFFQVVVFVLIFVVFIRRDRTPNIRQADEKILAQIGFQKPRHPLILAGLALLLAAIVLPFVSIFVGLFSPSALEVVGQMPFWHALGNSIGIAILAATLSLVVVVCANLSFREGYSWQNTTTAANRFAQKLPALPLFFSPIFLGAGLFIVQYNVGIPGFSSYAAVVLINAIMGIPFAHYMLSEDLRLAHRKYAMLRQSLGLGIWRSFASVDLIINRAPIRKAWALVAALSLGDITAISLFGSQDFATLPLLVSRLMGNYRNSEGLFVAAILCLLGIVFFVLADRYKLDSVIHKETG